MAKKILATLFLLMSARAAQAADPVFTPAQLASLKQTNRPIIVPKYLPAGFQVKKVMVEREPPEYPSYAILFSGPDNTCVAVEMGTEVGDMIVQTEKGADVKPSSVVANSLLGKTDFWDSKEYLGTNWFPPYQDTAYKIMGGDFSASSLSKVAEAKACKRLAGAELLNVAKSLGVYGK